MDTSFTSFRTIAENFNQNVVALVATTFIAMSVAAFFYGVFMYVVAVRGGDATKIKNGNQFMMWGLVALFVSFSVYGIIRFAQNITPFGSNNGTITIPRIEYQPGRGGTGSPTSPSAGTPTSPNAGTVQTFSCSGSLRGSDGVNVGKRCRLDNGDFGFCRVVSAGSERIECRNN